MTSPDSHNGNPHSRMARSPLSLPDDILDRVSYYLHVNDDYASLLALQRISRAGYDAATPLIYRDIRVETDRQWRSLLSPLVSDFNLVDQQTEGAMLFPSLCDVTLSRVTPSQHRILKAFSSIESLTLEEFPSNHSSDLASAARKIAHSATGRQFLFPSVKMIRITGRAPYLYRNNFIEWHGSEDGVEIPRYLSKVDGLGTLLNPSHLCVTQPWISVDFPSEAQFAADYLSTRAFGFLVDRLQEIFPHLETASLHGIVPHPALQFILPRCDTRIFMSASNTLPCQLDGHAVFSANAVHWLLGMIQNDFHHRSRNALRSGSRQLVGWERLPGRLLPLDWAGGAVSKTIAMLREAMRSDRLDSLLVNPKIAKTLGEEEKTLAKLSFSVDMEPCMICGGESAAVTSHHPR